MACKRSGVRIPIAPQVRQIIRTDRTARTAAQYSSAGPAGSSAPVSVRSSPGAGRWPGCRQGKTVRSLTGWNATSLCRVGRKVRLPVGCALAAGATGQALRLRRGWRRGRVAAAFLARWGGQGHTTRAASQAGCAAGGLPMSAAPGPLRLRSASGRETARVRRMRERVASGADHPSERRHDGDESMSSAAVAYEGAPGAGAGRAGQVPHIRQTDDRGWEAWWRGKG
jgi:hypothetical protein